MVTAGFREDVTFGFFPSGRVGGLVFETHAQWAGGRRFRICQWAGWVGVEFLSSKTGWAGPGARARPALSVVLPFISISLNMPPIISIYSASKKMLTSASSRRIVMSDASSKRSASSLLNF